MGGHEVTLVDTSSWIEFLRGRTSEAGLRVKELLKDERAGWCDLIAFELWNGVRPGTETNQLNELERELTCFDISAEVWKRARKVGLQSRKAGLTVPTADVIIAACAVHYGLELEHCDGHFEKLLPIAEKL